jgi:hypothetical protein
VVSEYILLRLATRVDQAVAAPSLAAADAARAATAGGQPVLGSVATRLYTIVSEIAKVRLPRPSRSHLALQLKAPTEWPDIAAIGARGPPPDPALEFVKRVMHVLLLDRALENELLPLRRVQPLLHRGHQLTAV